MLTASREYVNKTISLRKLADDVKENFQNDGYKAQLLDAPTGYLIQGRKEGVLRDLLTGDRALTVIITGESDRFKVSIGVGKWLQNITTATLEGLALTPLSWLIEVPLSMWNFELETQLWKFVEKQVELSSPRTTASA